MATIKQALIIGKDIPFMPADIEEYNEYIDNKSHYILRLYGSLVNGEKAVVTISGIKVFFDIRIPNNENIKLFESKIRDILTKEKNGEGETVDMDQVRIEYEKAFLIKRYHPEKKTYLHIVITTSKQKSIALNIILKYNSEIVKAEQEYKLKIASDNMSAYYRKVVREYKILLSGWALLTNYEYNSGRMPYSTHSPLCSHAFYVSINNYRSIKDPTVLYKTYPPSLITYDRTLVLAWDIETHSTRKLDHLPIAR